MPRGKNWQNMMMIWEKNVGTIDCEIKPLGKIYQCEII